MAIDFSKVKTITIPEGSVKKITDSNGNILWQEQPNNWHTIWEGNKTCSVKTNGNNNPTISGIESNFAQTNIGTGYTPKIRITFSYSITSHDNSLVDEFYLNNSKSNTFPSSPVIIDEVKNISTNRICGPLVSTSNSSAFARAILETKKDTNNNRLIINLEAYASNNITSYNTYFTATFTVTKIEQYYE